MRSLHHPLRRGALRPLTPGALRPLTPGALRPLTPGALRRLLARLSAAALPLSGVLVSCLPSLALADGPPGEHEHQPDQFNQPSQPGSCEHTWSLRVIDEATDEAIPGVRLTLRAPGAPAVDVDTDAAGTIEIDGFCPGPVRVSATKIEHASRTRTIEIAGAHTETTIALEPLHDHHSAQVIVVHDQSPAIMSASDQLAGAALAETRGLGLADAITGVSGVSALRGTSGGMAKPVIRGQIGRRNLIIFDGVRHEGQKWGLDHAPEIDPYAAGRITVIKGAATTRYGPDAIGGVVLVDPRPLPRSSEGPGVSGEFSTVGGSNPLGGGFALRLDHAPARAPGFAWRVEANAGRYRAALSPDYALDNTGALTWNVGARAGYLKEQVDVVVGYRLLRTKAGICSCLRISNAEEFQAAIDSAAPPNVAAYSAEFAIERPYQSVWHHLAMARTRVDLGRGGELHATYAFQFNDRAEFDIVRDNITGAQLRFGLRTHTGELRYEHRAVDLGRGWTLVGSLGADVSQQTNEFEGSTTLVPDYNQWSGGLSAVERFVGERLELEIGARYDGLARNAELAERDFLGQRAGGRLAEANCSRSDAANLDGARCQARFLAPSATLGLLARPLARAPEFSWRVQFDSSARLPAIDEQFMNGAAPSFPILGLGDSHLGVERTWSGASTWTYEGDQLVARASTYLNYVDDYIAFQPTPQPGQCAPLSCTTRGPMPVFAFEATDALFTGVELDLDWALPRLPFVVSGNAAWVWARDLGNDGFLPYIPADRYGLSGRYNWPDDPGAVHGYVEISGTYVARQRRYDPEAETDFAPPPPNYVLLGAAAGLELPLDATQIRLSLRGTNLLNRRTREYTSLLRYFADDPGWGLQLRLSVEI